MDDYSEKESKTISTYDRNARLWTGSHASKKNFMGMFSEFKELLPSGSILEIGCGGGRDAEELLRLGYKYIGIDASKGMVEVAKKINPGADFRVLNLYELDKLDMKYDGFWSAATYLHIPKTRIDEALGSLRSVLKDGAIGMISMKDGNKEDFEVRVKDGMEEQRLFIYWSRDEFGGVLNKNGFEIIRYHFRPQDERTNWHIFYVKKVSLDK